MSLSNVNSGMATSFSVKRMLNYAYYDYPTENDLAKDAAMGYIEHDDSNVELYEENSSSDLTNGLSKIHLQGSGDSNAKKKRGRDIDASSLLSMDAENLKQALINLSIKMKVDEKASIDIQDLIKEYEAQNQPVLYRSKLSSALKRRVGDSNGGDMECQPTKINDYEEEQFRRLGKRDYNNEFQNAMEDVHGMCCKVKMSPISDTMPHPELREKFEKIDGILGDFYYAAKCYARIIVNELSMPYEEKTIKPLSVKTTGSIKYIHKGIVFKIATDKIISTYPTVVWKYGGEERNDLAARKAAAKEFTALNFVYAFECNALCLPLMLMIDYKGFRLLATPVLPINKNTIVYGTNDKGATIHADDPSMNKILAQLAEKLRLKKTRVGRTLETSKEIFFPADFNVHKGTDGRYYAVNYGRIFPPENPCFDPKIACTTRERHSIYYKFFRPEFHLSSRNKTLSANAFCLLSKVDPEAEQNEIDVYDATTRLFEKTIPDFARDLERHPINKSNDHFNFALNLITNIRVWSRAKFFGINMRHMGRVRAHLTSEEHRILVLSLSIARVVKNRIREAMITISGSTSLCSDAPFKTVAVREINAVLGGGANSDVFWKEIVKVQLEKMYPHMLTPEELDPNFDLRTNTNLFITVVGLLLVTGFIIKSDALKALITSPSTFQLLETDMVELAPKIRFLGINFTMKSWILRMSAAESDNPDSITRMLYCAYKICSNCIACYPKCPATNIEFSRVLFCLITKSLKSYRYHTRNLRVSNSPPSNHIADLQYLFFTAFQHAEHSVCALPSKDNLAMWIKIAELYVEWKIILDQHDLANKFQQWTTELCKKLEEKGEKEYCGGITSAAELKQFRESTDPQQISVVKEEKVSCSFQDLLAIGYRFR